MKSGKPQTIDIADEIQEIAKDFTSPVFKIMARLDAVHGDGAGVYFLGCLVGAVIGGGLMKTLTAASKDSRMTKEQRVEEAMDRLKNVKGTMQEAVSAGFSGGMSTFSGKEIEYYCRIQVVPPMASKQRN